MLRLAALVATGVPGHDRHAEARPFVAHRLPVLGEHRVREVRRQCEAHAGISRRNARRPEVGGDQVAGEPRRTARTECRDHAERVRRDRQHTTRPDAHDRRVVSRARPGEHFGPLGAQARRDHAREHLGRDLAQRGDGISRYGHSGTPKAGGPAGKRLSKRARPAPAQGTGRPARGTRVFQPRNAPSANTTPVGSTATEKRPMPGISVGGTHDLPPSESARAWLASTSATAQ